MKSSETVPAGADRTALRQSYLYCERVARTTGRNFYYSFLVLPKPRRRAMCALYAFMRKTDDLGDADLDVELRRQNLADWRQALNSVLSGEKPAGPQAAADPCWPALADIVVRYDIPASLLHEVIDGCEWDLDHGSYDTFDELYRYCYQVASAVGLACIRIWGASDRRADLFAEKCGIAFQLTNIIRDITEDLDRGRIYLPQEDLRQFGVTGEDLRSRKVPERVEDLLRFEIARAELYYRQAEEIYDYLPAPGRAVQKAMMDIYHGLLGLIARDPKAVFQKRVSLSKARKLWIVATALPKRFSLF